jgi:hypothetical protein
MYEDLGKNLEAVIKKEDPEFKRNLPSISPSSSKVTSPLNSRPNTPNS